MTDHLKRVRELSRQLDALEAERDTMTAEINGRINRLNAELASFVKKGNEVDTADDEANTCPVAGNGESISQGDKVVALLRAHPGADTKTLVLHLYGEETPVNRNRVRSLMHFLKGKKTVKRIPGKQAHWEVAA